METNDNELSEIFRDSKSIKLSNQIMRLFKRKTDNETYIKFGMSTIISLSFV